MNTAVNKTTGATPFELLYGQVARQPYDLPPPDQVSLNTPDTPSTNFADEIMRRMAVTADAAAEAEARAVGKRADVDQYARRSSRIHVGDLVWIRNEEKHKLEDRWVGPYLVWRDVTYGKRRAFDCRSTVNGKDTRAPIARMRLFTRVRDFDEDRVRERTLKGSHEERCYRCGCEKADLRCIMCPTVAHWVCAGMAKRPTKRTRERWICQWCDQREEEAQGTATTAASPSHSSAASGPIQKSSQPEGPTASARKATTKTKNTTKGGHASDIRNLPTLTEEDAEAMMEDLEDDEYLAECLVKHRIGRSGRYEYLVKWYGYDHSDDTWEADSNVRPALLKEYWRRTVGSDGPPTDREGRDDFTSSDA